MKRHLPTERPDHPGEPSPPTPRRHHYVQVGRVLVRITPDAELHDRWPRRLKAQIKAEAATRAGPLVEAQEHPDDPWYVLDPDYIASPAHSTTPWCVHI